MNEITYRPDEEAGFSAILRRQAETHADFTYSLSGNVISIVDLNLGNRSWAGIHWDGEHASFFALREIEEGRAREKLLARSK